MVDEKTGQRVLFSTSVVIWLLLLPNLVACSGSDDHPSLEGNLTGVDSDPSTEDYPDGRDGSEIDSFPVSDPTDLGHTEVRGSVDAPQGDYYRPGTICSLVVWSCGNAAMLQYVGREDVNYADKRWTEYRFSGDSGEVHLLIECLNDDPGLENCAGFQFHVSDTWFLASLPGELPRHGFINAFAEREGVLVDVWGRGLVLDSLEVLQEEYSERSPLVPEQCRERFDASTEPWCPNDFALYD